MSQTWNEADAADDHETEHLTNEPARMASLRSCFSGATAPTSPTPVAGQWFYNTTLNRMQYYNGAAWITVTAQELANTFGVGLNGQQTFKRGNAGSVIVVRNIADAADTWVVTDTGKVSVGIVPRARWIAQSADIVNTTNWTTAGATIGTFGSVTVTTGNFIEVAYHIGVVGATSQTTARFRIAQSAGTATIKEVHNTGQTINSTQRIYVAGSVPGNGFPFNHDGVIQFYIVTGGTVTLTLQGNTQGADAGSASNTFQVREVIGS